VSLQTEVSRREKKVINRTEDEKMKQPVATVMMIFAGISSVARRRARSEGKAVNKHHADDTEPRAQKDRDSLP